MLSIIMLSVVMLSANLLRVVQLRVILLLAVVLNVVALALSVVMLRAVMVSAVAPLWIFMNKISRTVLKFKVISILSNVNQHYKSALTKLTTILIVRVSYHEKNRNVISQFL